MRAQRKGRGLVSSDGSTTKKKALPYSTGGATSTRAFPRTPLLKYAPSVVTLMYRLGT